MCPTCKSVLLVLHFKQFQKADIQEQVLQNYQTTFFLAIFLIVWNFLLSAELNGTSLANIFIFCSSGSFFDVSNLWIILNQQVS